MPDKIKALTKKGSYYRRPFCLVIYAVGKCIRFFLKKRKEKKKKRFIRVTERTTESMVRVSETKGFIFLFLGGGLLVVFFG
jgi:DNA replicative helicase MCM subunit Mcm2 (Cdc46/Mcm family)